ncbi:hypothetical protein UlMin_006851 [Ulmus minor]
MPYQRGRCSRPYLGMPSKLSGNFCLFMVDFSGWLKLYSKLQACISSGHLLVEYSAASGGTHPESYRVLTVRELARVQGFPDFYKLCGPIKERYATFDIIYYGTTELVALLPHYNPPNLNKDITEIFGKLINIYRALGGDRRSFSYHKAIPVIEKLPFKIESVEQVKHFPSIGKSMQDHIQEIVTTGKLSKLEHFETDEKARTISLCGEVWGIGPATALKLYEKGYRTLDDLKNESSLTNAQKLGLKYFHDIQQRIPRHEVQEMESLLKTAAEEILPEVRGEASCGDMDIIITHPDGKRFAIYVGDFVNFTSEMLILSNYCLFSSSDCYYYYYHFISIVTNIIITTITIIIIITVVGLLLDYLLNYLMDFWIFGRICWLICVMFFYMFCVISKDLADCVLFWIYWANL